MNCSMYTPVITQIVPYHMTAHKSLIPKAAHKSSTQNQRVSPLPKNSAQVHSPDGASVWVGLTRLFGQNLGKKFWENFGKMDLRATT